MKKSYHSIIVPAVDAAITRQIPAGAFSSFVVFSMALILVTTWRSYNRDFSESADD